MPKRRLWDVRGGKVIELAVVDCGVGNAVSVANAVIELGSQPQVTNEPNEVVNAVAVILPGLGSAPDAMHKLRETGLDEAIRHVIRQGHPFFGISVGMHVLLSVAEDDEFTECLDVIPGAVRRLPWGLQVTHTGWRPVKQAVDHPVFDGIPDNTCFYFDH